MVPPGCPATAVASVTSRLVSSVVSGRRYARWPSAEIACEAHVVSVAVVGTQASAAFARVGSASTHDAAALAAASYNPMPDADDTMLDEPIDTNPSISRSGSSGPMGAPDPNRSRTLLAYCDDVMRCTCATGSTPPGG